MAASFVLADSQRLRFLTGSIMYFGQGIPQGLLMIAIPAWLASLGVGASDIATFLAVVILPWAFKLVTGPLMDRYEFLPMGRRRPWVIAAQLGLSLSLLALIFVDRPAEQMPALMLIGVLINSFAATQDVAVDGMSIDLTPVREQGRLNAFMSFGKAMGWAATSAVSGVLLVTFGMAVTAIVSSAVAGIVLLVIIFAIERDGERLLPWSKGEAATVHQPGSSFKIVFAALNKVLWSRTSVLVMIIMVFDGLVIGYGQALMPIAAVKLFGYTTPEWGQLVAMMGLIGAVITIGLGPLVDRFGAKSMLILTISVVGVHAFLIAQTQHLWQDTLYVRLMLSIWVMMLPIVMVCSLALAMAICSSSISATQFAIYMSLSNLGYSAGSKVYGTVAEQSTYVETYTLLGIFVITMVSVLFFHRHRHDEATPQGTRQKPTPQYSIVFGSSDAGFYRSGAMRCPKCRADMDQVVQDGVEVDRCMLCNGIWFDAGEIEQLKTKKAAAAIDTGDAATGKQRNAIDNYRCPRCSGTMIKMVDTEQRHIWYEKCSDCHGSFFDAGEFRDLAERSISDFFKGMAAPKRT
jgi:PAT family beta-lactamase induction signal transducer AmpG